MNQNELLNEDGRVILALCSTVGLKNAGGSELEPFKLSEWNQLSRKIADSSLKTPANLSGRDAAELSAALELDPEEGQRIETLLGRSGILAKELETLYSRGIWVITRDDEGYPEKLRILKNNAPSILYGAGDVQLLNRNSLAVVGSRDIDEVGIKFAQELGRKAVASKLAVVSGGARGTDRIAMQAALESGGASIGIVPDSLERTVRQPDVVQYLQDSSLCLITPFAPSAGFSVGNAMGRNKLIYALADYAAVVSSDYQTGGTWAGATETLKAGWRPVFVRAGENVPKGNKELQKLGAAPLTECDLADIGDLGKWMRENRISKPVEQDLF